MKWLSGFTLDTHQRRKAIVLFAILNFMMLALFLCLRLLPPSQYAFYPKCIWYSLTNTYCPGCGSTRSFNAIAQGAFLDVFKYNMLIPLFFPYLIYWYIMQGISAFTGRRPFVISFNNKELYGVFILVVLFWILRNFIPFLAPAPQ